LRASYGELLVVLRLPQATAELLEPEDPRLRGPQHEDGVELGEVEALVEDVDRADDLEVAARQLLQRLRSGGRACAGLDGHRAQTLLLEEVGHEVRVALRDAEGQGAGAAALLELVVGVSGSGLGRDVAGELLLVEAGVAPGDVPVVDLVRDAEVPEAAEEVLLDARDQVAAVDEVLLAQGEEVAAVGALRGGGEGEQELRAEVIDEAAVGRCRGVVGPGRFDTARYPQSATHTSTTVSAVHCEPVRGPNRLSIRRKSSISRQQP